MKGLLHETKSMFKEQVTPALSESSGASDRRFAASLLLALCSALLVVAFSVYSVAQTPITLSLDPATPVAGTSVGFTSDDSGVVSPKILAGLPLRTATTQDKKYLIMVDIESYHRDKFHRFAFDSYVKALSGRSAKSVHKFNIWADAIGTFSDVIGAVTAHVSGPSGPDVQVIQVPLHSDDSPSVNIDRPTAPYPVPMGHSSRMELGLSSNLSNLHLTINPTIRIEATQCPECWGSFNSKVLHDKLGSGQKTSLIVDLQPNSLAAFKRNLVVFNSNTSQEDLIVTVVSRSDDGGSDVAQDFRIPVRFTPPGPFLLLSVLGGVLIGCGIRYFISLQTPPKLSIVEAVITVATAIVVWLLVLGLFATKTKATVVGYDLDPTQVVPAGLITLLAAGGTPFSRRIAELLKV